MFYVATEEGPCWTTVMTGIFLFSVSRLEGCLCEVASASVIVVGAKLGPWCCVQFLTDVGQCARV
jgi:hypothetical protein